MKLYAIIILFSVIIIGCGDSDRDTGNNNIVSVGEIFGIITDKETGFPVKEATITIGAKTAITDANGKYSIKDIPFSDNINVVVTALEYESYTKSISLDMEILALNIEIIPTKSPSAPILTVLDKISKGIESLDNAKIPEIQSYFAKEYIAGDDQATIFAIVAGVVPPKYDAIPQTMENINKKYAKLAFKFANPNISFQNDTATVLMQFMVDAITNPPEPKKWDIIVDGKMIFKKQGDEWKMSFWALIPPFIKFEENPI
ncbi:TPA: hypothetical protein ENS27_00330 [bacterium]|nr:hypothetical protein [bacterium]